MIEDTRLPNNITHVEIARIRGKGPYPPVNSWLYFFHPVLRLPNHSIDNDEHSLPAAQQSIIINLPLFLTALGNNDHCSWSWIGYRCAARSTVYLQLAQRLHQGEHITSVRDQSCRLRFFMNIHFADPAEEFQPEVGFAKALQNTHQWETVSMQPYRLHQKLYSTKRVDCSHPYSHRRKTAQL